MKKKKIKEVFFRHPDIVVDKMAAIPVALYLKEKSPYDQRFEEFVLKMKANDQGLEVIACYRDYEGKEGTSFRKGLQTMMSDLLSHNRKWLAIIIDSEDNFPFGTREYDDLCKAKTEVPVFASDFVKNFKG